MIQFNFKISTLGSRLHFIMSLAGINPVMGDSFVEPLLKTIGPLSDSEKNNLAEISKAINKLPENDRKSLIANSFLNDKDYSLENFPSLSELFARMNEKFERYWTSSEKSLLSTKKIIIDDAETQKDTLNKGVQALNILFGKTEPKNVEVYLVYSPINNISGKLISENSVYVEVPDSLDFDIIKFCLLLLHEVIHASYEPFEYKMWLKNFANKQEQTDLSQRMGPKNLLRELIDSAIAPNGYFADYLYSVDIRKRLRAGLESNHDALKNSRTEFNYLKKIVALNLYDEISNYIQNSKKIDENILEIAWNSILDKKILPRRQGQSV